MRDKADTSSAPRKRTGVADAAPYVLIVGAVALAWQITIQPLLQRAPVEVAIRLGPASPLALRRAAESELLAGRIDNAAALGRDALVRSPFDVRALRVVGLTEARAGREGQADEILTLAGNWSLRDDPAHAWLVQHRLRQGDYASSFAHADTLVRRREDIQPQIFRLFTLAGAQDAERSLPVLASLLAANPPWRTAYLQNLNTSAEGLQVAASLAVLLQISRAPFTNDELRRFYVTLINQNQLEAVRVVRERLNRPPTARAVTNGDFGDPTAPEPFQWRLAERAGVVAEIAPDELRSPDPALRVDYDGYSSVRAASQLMLLPAGRHQLRYETRVEAGAADRLVWTITCTPGNRTIAASAPVTAEAGPWLPKSLHFEVPANCPAQWLRLESRGGDQRSRAVIWFDRMSVLAGDGSDGSAP